MVQSESCGFFDGDTLYGQEEFNRYFNHLFESGVSFEDSGEMALKAKESGGKVVLGKGFAIVKGFYYYNNADITYQVTPDTLYPRRDRLVLRANLLSGPVESMVKKGVPSSAPTLPALQRDTGIYEISLAEIKIMPDGKITVIDERYKKDVCGAIRPKNLTELNTMMAEMRKNWEKWFASLSGVSPRRIYLQENAPSDSVVGSVWI